MSSAPSSSVHARTSDAKDLYFAALSAALTLEMHGTDAKYPRGSSRISSNTSVSRDADVMTNRFLPSVEYVRPAALSPAFDSSLIQSRVSTKEPRCEKTRVRHQVPVARLVVGSPLTPPTRC